MVTSSRVNGGTTRAGAEARALELAAVVAAAAAERAAGSDRVVQFGRYQLLRSLGQGGMGLVFAAWDTQLERHVALKLVLRGGARATLDEARCLARLAHPNVVSVHEVGEVDGLVYLAMELVDGPSLRRWARAGADGRARGWATIVTAVVAAGRGLAAVHDVGLLHGDIKSSNILIGSDARVRVADFGLARIHLGPVATSGEGDPPAEPGSDSPRLELDALVQRALAAVDPLLDAEQPSSQSTGGESSRSPVAGERGGGTLAYMAPERLAGAPGSPAADQYSLCATAWEALFGAPPSARVGVGSPGRIGNPPRWRLAAHACPPGVVAVLQRGLARDADARWPSVDALCTALERARERSTRRVSRARRLALASSVLAAMAAGVVGVGELEPAAHHCRAASVAVAASWTALDQAHLEARLLRSDLPLPREEARFVASELDAWIADWSVVWERACVAEPIVRRCLEHERTRFEAVVELLASPEDGRVDVPSVARALVGELGSPRACLAERQPEQARGAWHQLSSPRRTPGLNELTELFAIERRLELAVLAGANERAAQQLARFDAIVSELEARGGGQVPELALRRLAVEPLRARVLLARGETDRARLRLRASVREAEARGHDELRFTLLLAQALLAGDVLAGARAGVTLDDLAVLDGLAERVRPSPVARAQLSLLRAGTAKVEAALVLPELEAASRALDNPRQPHRYAALRFELALRRAELHFELGDLPEAERLARRARAIAERSRLRARAPSRVVAALQLAGVAAALQGRCEPVATIVEAIDSIREEVEAREPQLCLEGHVDSPPRSLRPSRSWGGASAWGWRLAVDWGAVREVCPYAGADLQAVLEPR